MESNSPSLSALSPASRSPVEEMQRALARVGRSSRAARIHAVLRLHGRAVAGVVAEHPDAERCTALHVAAQTACTELAADLLALGVVVDVDARDARAGTPLHFAVVNGALDVARLLVDAGANLNAVDVDGNAPLHDAVVRNREDAVRLLVERGASRALRNNQGQTPADLAESFSMHWLLPLVREEGFVHGPLHVRRKQQAFRALGVADKPDTPKRPRGLPEEPSEDETIGFGAPSSPHQGDRQKYVQPNHAFHVPQADATRPILLHPSPRQCRVVPPPADLPSIAVTGAPRDSDRARHDAAPTGAVAHSEICLAQAVLGGMHISASERAASDSGDKSGHEEEHRMAKVEKQSWVLQVPESGATSIRPESHQVSALSGKSSTGPCAIDAALSQELDKRSKPLRVSNMRPIVAHDEGKIHVRNGCPDKNCSSNHKLSSQPVSDTYCESDLSETPCWPSSSLLRRLHTLSPDELEPHQSSNSKICNALQLRLSVGVNGAGNSLPEQSSTTLVPLPIGTVSSESAPQQSRRLLRSMRLDMQVGDIRKVEPVHVDRMDPGLVEDQIVSDQRPILSCPSETADVGSCLNALHVVGSGTTRSLIPESDASGTESGHRELEDTENSGNGVGIENISAQSTTKGRGTYFSGSGRDEDTSASAAAPVCAYEEKLPRRDTPRSGVTTDDLGLQQNVMQAPGSLVFQKRLWVGSANERTRTVLADSKSSVPLDDCDSQTDQSDGMKLPSLVTPCSETPPAILDARKLMEDAIGLPSCKSNIVEIRSLVEAFGCAVSNVKSPVRDMQTPLHRAAIHGTVQLARLLVGDSADVEATEARFGRTPLHFAAKYGNAELAHVLVHEFKAQTDLHDRLGNTALDLAMSNGDQATIDVFSDLGMTSNNSSTSRQAAARPGAFQRSIMPKAGNNSNSTCGNETESANSSDELHLNRALRRKDTPRIAPKTVSVAVMKANSGYSSSASDEAQYLDRGLRYEDKPSDEAIQTVSPQTMSAVFLTATGKAADFRPARAENGQPISEKVKSVSNRSVSDFEVVGNFKAMVRQPRKGSPTARVHLSDGFSRADMCSQEKNMVSSEPKPSALHEDADVSGMSSEQSRASLGKRAIVKPPTTGHEITGNTVTANVVRDSRELTSISSRAQVLPNCMMVPERLMEAAIGLPDMDSDCARILALVETYGKSLVNFQAKQRGGQTALHRAAFHQHIDLLELLLHNGADPNTRDERFRSMPLHTAASNGSEAAVDALVQFGADVNAQSMFGAPLHLAAWHNQARLAHKLLKYGADITVRNANGLNPRDVARVRNHDQITQLFDKYLTSHEEL
jgi:ankyrin repeat protein